MADKTKTSSEAKKQARERSILFDLPRLLLKSPSGMLGFIIVLVVVLISVFANVIIPCTPEEIDLANMAQPPCWLEGGSAEHILIGSRVSLLVGIFSVVVAGIIGTIMGILSGYFGGWIDSVVMRITDAFYSIPLTLFAMVILTIMDPGVLTLVFVIGVTNWPFYARMVRSEVLGLKNKEYIKAARTIGTSGKMIMLRHILPNILPTFIVVSTLSVASSILIEASLSFLGLGIQPPAVSWGVMLSDGRNYLATNWWMATFPGIAISLTVLGIMLLGNWLRDVLDPKNQGLR